jgi:hypothetical protein
VGVDASAVLRRENNTSAVRARQEHKTNLDPEKPVFFVFVFVVHHHHHHHLPALAKNEANDHWSVSKKQVKSMFPPHNMTPI